jgi:hypothetical protein
MFSWFLAVLVSCNVWWEGGDILFRDYLPDGVELRALADMVTSGYFF